MGFQSAANAQAQGTQQGMMFQAAGGNQNGGSPGSSYTFCSNGGTQTTSSAQPAVTVDTSTTGGTETKPKNYGVLYIIKT